MLAASLRLTAAVTLNLGRAALTDPAAILTAAALFLLFRFEVNTSWLIVGGVIVGVLVQALS